MSALEVRSHKGSVSRQQGRTIADRERAQFEPLQYTTRHRFGKELPLRKPPSAQNETAAAGEKTRGRRPRLVHVRAQPIMSRKLHSGATQDCSIRRLRPAHAGSRDRLEGANSPTMWVVGNGAAALASTCSQAISDSGPPSCRTASSATMTG